MKVEGNIKNVNTQTKMYFLQIKNINVTQIYLFYVAFSKKCEINTPTKQGTLRIHTYIYVQFLRCVKYLHYNQRFTCKFPIASRKIPLKWVSHSYQNKVVLFYCNVPTAIFCFYSPNNNIIKRDDV